MTDLIPTGKQILAAQPFSLLLGAELVAFETGSRLQAFYMSAIACAGAAGAS